jgi:hypothetical protein
MENSENSVSEYSWLTVSSKDEPQLTTLPRVIRTFEEFAKVDVYTGNIDPTYWVLNRAKYKKGHGYAARLCVAMLAYYDMGTAEILAKTAGSEFWDYMFSIYNTAKRATERRHFRGIAGTQALTSMRNFSPVPENFFEQFPPTYSGVKKMCEDKLVGFGPYFQLKICDYMDRCLDIKIQSYAGLGRNLPGFPLKAAHILTPSATTDFDAFQAAVDRVTQLNLLAPPKFDRPMGPAEVETLLCDWKRAKSGSSWMGKDNADKFHELTKGGELQGWMPQLIKEGTFTLELV